MKHVRKWDFKVPQAKPFDRDRGPLVSSFSDLNDRKLPQNRYVWPVFVNYFIVGTSFESLLRGELYSCAKS
jgi:hypothetical protein